MIQPFPRRAIQAKVLETVASAMTVRENCIGSKLQISGYLTLLCVSHLIVPSASRRYRAITSCSTQGGISGWNLLRR